MSLWLFIVYMDGVMNEMKMGMGRRGVSFKEDCLAYYMQITWFYVVN